MVSSSLPVALLGFAAHATALWVERLQIPGHLQTEAVKYLGRLVWLTFQTNLLCACYYGIGVASHAFPALDAYVVQLFPLAFCLGFALSLLYYGLDHFNPSNIKKRKYYSAKGYPHCEIASHLQHGSGTPMALLHAMTSSFTTSDPAVRVIAFMLWYILMTLANKCATGHWQYPILNDAQRVGGVLGIATFFCVISSVCVGFSYLGNWIVEL